MKTPTPEEIEAEAIRMVGIVNSLYDATAAAQWKCLGDDIKAGWRTLAREQLILRREAYLDGQLRAALLCQNYGTAASKHLAGLIRIGAEGT